LTLIARLWLLRARFLVAAAGSERLSPPLLANVHEGADAGQLVFRLRHVHGVNSETHSLVLKNVLPGASSQSVLTLRTERVGVHRPKSRLTSWLAPVEWDEDKVEGPDVTDKDTLIALAKMTSNAYYDSPDTGKSGWYNLGDRWNIVRSLRLLRRATHSLGN
jgi:putative lipase involved disintegration of autophagic bodies